MWRRKRRRICPLSHHLSELEKSAIQLPLKDSKRPSERIATGNLFFNIIKAKRCKLLGRLHKRRSRQFFVEVNIEAFSEFAEQGCELCGVRQDVCFEQSKR